MADARKIIIEIVSKDGGGGAGAADGSAASGRKDDPNSYIRKSLTGMFHPINSLESTLSNKGQWAFEMGKQAVSEAYNIALMEHNRYFTLKEDYIGQNEMAMFTKTVDTAKGILGGVASGAISGGAAAGIYGAIIGAVAGGVTSVWNARKTALQTLEQYQMQLNATNKQTSFAERRASLVNGGKGTEN